MFSSPKLPMTVYYTNTLYLQLNTMSILVIHPVYHINRYIIMQQGYYEVGCNIFFPSAFPTTANKIFTKLLHITI